MTELQRAKEKLARLEREMADNDKAIRFENDSIPFGQPNIEGRRNIYANVQRMYHKARKLYEEREQQIDRIEKLEKVEQIKADNELLKDVHIVGETKYATVGAKTSVNNLDYFKAKLQELEEANEKAKAYNKTKPAVKMQTLGAEITKLKRKIEMLETMKEKDENKTISEQTQHLIEQGLVNQWKKKPIYYFVKGLKKVALEIDEQGDFFISRRYPAYSEEDKIFIDELLNK